MGRSKLQQRYYDPKRVGSYGGVAALRRVVPEQDVERWLSEQDTYTLSQTGETSFQTPLRCSGRSKSTVASRPSRHVAVEEGQRWNNIHTDCDRCVFQTTLVRSAKEQVSSLVGGRPLHSLLSNGAPNTLQTDKGTEFVNRSLQKLLKEHGVHHFCGRTTKKRRRALSRGSIGH